MNKSFHIRNCIAAAAFLTLHHLPASAETPKEIAAILSEGNPHVAKILADHPEFLEVWKEGFWADAILRGEPIPGTPWRTHDLRRPQPPVMMPTADACFNSEPPAQAHVLLDEKSARFSGERIDQWTFNGGVLTASGEGGGTYIESEKAFGDVRIHLEFRTPDIDPLGAFQYRGNSGVVLMGRYEIQILDSYHNPVYPDGSLGALYGQSPPLVNAALPPGQWQCMDILFRAPQFDEYGADKKLQFPAFATVIINGVVVQNQTAFLGPTAFGVLPPYSFHKPRLPFKLQDHGDLTSRVSFRNIWALPLERLP